MCRKIPNVIKFIIPLFVLVVIAACFRLKKVELTNDITAMLPQNSQQLQQTFEFINNTTIADQILVTVSLKDGKKNPAKLEALSEALSQPLKHQLISEIFYKVDQAKGIEDSLGFQKLGPELIDKSVFKQQIAALQQTGVRKKVKHLFTKLIQPGGNFMKPFLTQDPLFLLGAPLNNLRKETERFDFNIVLDNGYLFNKDKTHLLMVLKTDVGITDSLKAQVLMAHIDKVVNQFKSKLNIQIICGHKHSLSNERIVRSDVQKVTIITIIAFLIIFLLFFRDWKASIIFLIPIVALIPSFLLTILFFDKISYIVLGFGAVVVGIAIDYGIHVFVACKVQGGDIKSVQKPIIAGCLTTLCAFTGLFFSSVDSYKQLAFFSTASILFCLILSITILPKLIRENINYRLWDTRLTSQSKRVSKLLLALWICFNIVALLTIKKLDFSTDIRQFDGSDPKIFEAEKAFANLWGTKEGKAILVTKGQSLEKALVENEKVTKAVTPLITDHSFGSVSNIWKSATTRTQNKQAWLKFWQSDEGKKLLGEFKKETRKLGFTAASFQHFYNLTTDTSLASRDTVFKDGFLAKIMARYIIKKGKSYYILNYLNDTEENLEALKSYDTKENLQHFIVSKKRIPKLISSTIMKEFKFLFILAISGIVICVVIIMRSLKEVVLSFLPVFTAFLAIIFTCICTHTPFGATTFIAALVVAGLSIDYGIFMVSSLKSPQNHGTVTAIILSAATTIAGSGALLVAAHPVMWGIGRTLVPALIAATFTSIYIIPIGYNFNNRIKENENI